MKYTSLLRKILVAALLVLGNNCFAQLTPLTIGIIPKGDSIIVQHMVTITGSSNVSNQGTITGSNISSTLTNDPKTAPANDPTITQVSNVGVNLSINDVSLNEGNAGTTTFTFIVSLSAPAPAGGVTFDIATADGTATQPGDYTSKSLIGQTIPAGSTTYTFDVLVNGDITVEPNETFFVNVTNVLNANVADGQGQGTITNDDASALPDLTINDVTMNEGNAGSTIYTFTVTLSSPAPAGGVTFDIATADGTGTIADNDYVARSLTSQTISAGNTTYTFDVTVNGDLIVEPNETFFVNVTNVTNATVTDGQGQGTITNDDGPVLPNLTIDDVTHNEGNAGTTTYTFTISLSSPAPTGGVTFNIATADNTATVADNDYVARSLTTQTITAGNTTYTFDVTVNGDVSVEPNETFFVNVTNVTNANVTDGQGQGTITNDDGAVISNNAYLSNLTISQGTLTPVFQRGVTSYHDAVANSVASVTVTPTAEDAGSAIKVNGNTVASGSPSSSIPLSVGDNTINVVVTAADGVTTKTYTIVVNRGAAGTNFYVSTSGDDHNDGSSAHPFRTLQHANDTSIVHNGDIINVLAGDYTEFVDVTKSLRFYGPNADISPNGGSRNPEAVLHASSTPVYPHDANGTTVFEAKTSGTNIEVKGFKLMGGDPIHDGHYHRTAGSPQDIIILFEKNWVSNADHLFAGTLTKWKTVTIRDNLFQNINSSANVSSAIQLNDGIELPFTAPTYSGYPATVTATIEDNVINTTEFAGILLDNIATATVQRNKLSNMKGEAGIQLAGGMGYATVSMNEIDHANTASAAGNDDGGIKIYGSDFTGTVNITNNTITSSLNGFVVKSGQNISGKSITVNNNSFDATTITNKVIYNAGTGTLAATCNWYNITPCGNIGARISGTVTYDPSLNSGTDNDPATMGFQPAGTCVSCSAPIAISVTPSYELHLYPVPVSDMLKIKYTSPQQSKVSITIIDEVGRVALTENTIAMKGINVMSLSVYKLQKGIYAVIIDNGKIQSRGKMIKL